MFPKTGRKFPSRVGVASSTYATVMADILKSELGSTHRAHKTLMRWTGANERTAKNWLSGSNGPSGEHLLQLMRNSDQVFEFVLRLSQRPVILSNQRLAEVRNSLQVAADLLSEVIDLQVGLPAKNGSPQERDNQVAASEKERMKSAGLTSFENPA